MHKCICGNEFDGKFCNECGLKFEETEMIKIEEEKKEYNRSKKYKVTGTITNDGEYYPGDLVEFYVLFVTDSSISVTSNDVKLKQDSNNYSFIMPEKDVEISIEVHSNMMNVNKDKPMGMMGMMGTTNIIDYNNLNKE